MREIKFRAISISNGKFIESMTISKGGIRRNRDCYYMEMGIDNWKGVDPDTIGQFTGLKDSVENDIFDGDIVEYDEFAVSNPKKNVRIEVKIPEIYLRLSGIKNVEIIGNIHQNPELMETTK